jgi:hypothetical protein
MEHKNLDRSLDRELASASIIPISQQDDASLAMRDEKQSIIPEAVEDGSDVRSLDEGSTGPRSKVGKRRSSQNAFKHGIFAKVVLIPGESRAKYRSLLKNLQEDWQPEHTTEEFLVEMIANIMWHLRRLYAAEGAEIRRSREFLDWDKWQSQAGEAEEIGTKSGDASQLFDPEPGLIWKIQNPIILNRCLELLWGLQDEIKAGGFDRNANSKILETIYGTGKHLRKTLHQSYLEYSETAELGEEGQRQGYATPEECKKYFLSKLAREIRRLRSYQREHDSVESERMELEVLRRNVPGPESWEHLRKN